MKSVLFKLSLLIPVLFFLSCDKDCPDFNFTAEPIQLAADIQIIEDYLSANGLTAEKTESGLHYIINEQGEGGNPCTDSRVTVAYKGYLTNGQVFDENADGITFGLQQVIPGWTEGIPLFKKGGSGVLLIPSGMAYGTAGRAPSIPPNTVLIFDVNLISF